MKSPASTQAITTADAEIACTRGEAATLSQYLRQTLQPSLDVIQNIATCLLANLPGNNLGPGDWKLKFSPRNGRPPKKHPEITDAASAIEHGQTILLGQYLRATPTLDNDARLALATALDPKPSAASKWQLKYAHARRGFPRSELKNVLILAKIGDRALQLRNEGKSWREIYSDLPHAETLIKKAVRFVLKTRAEGPAPGFLILTVIPKPPH
jgi:hypothetical protein